MNDRFDIEEGQEVVRTAIVGGRPRARRKRKIAIPIGLEKVLTRAAGDPAFRRRLFEDRRATLASLGWELQPSEAVILGAVPDDVLDTMIGRIDLKEHTKRRFLKGIATAVFATAAMTSGVVSCGDVASKGVRPDDAQSEAFDEGLRPDVAEVDDREFVSKGDLADLPDLEDVPISAGVDIRPPDEVEPDEIPVDLGAGPDVVEPDEVITHGILPEINEVEVDQGQNDGGVRPDTDVQD